MQTHRVVYVNANIASRAFIIGSPVVFREGEAAQMVKLYDSSLGAIHDQVVVNPREADGNADA